MAVERTRGGGGEVVFCRMRAMRSYHDAGAALPQRSSGVHATGYAARSCCEGVCAAQQQMLSTDNVQEL